MNVCFIGHRNIVKTKELVCSLNNVLTTLLEKGVTTFMFGSMSEFDNLSWEVVTKLKEKYPFIKRVYVRSAYQDIDESYKNYLLESFEETYFPQQIANAGKYSYVERNCEMINKSTFCIFYYNENYIPKSKKQKNSSILKQRNSGTKIAFEYATKKKKQIINLYNTK